VLSRRRSSRRPVLLVVALATVAAGGVALVRSGRTPALRRPESLPGPLSRLESLPGPLGRPKPGQEDFRCECGARYRVSGIDRHRVYWPAGAGENEPLLGTECTSCGRPLPA